MTTIKNSGVSDSEFKIVSMDVANKRIPLPSDKLSFFSLGAINPPKEILQKIHDVLLPYSTPFTPPTGRYSPPLHNGNGVIWLVSSGHLVFHRNYDNLKVAIVQGPTVAGLAEVFGPLGRHYFRASRGAKVFSVPIDQARKVFNEQQLWEDVAEALAFFLRFMCYRDEHLVSKHSYSILRAKLFEYMDKKTFNEQDRVGIVAYIQDTTHLSRSLIYNMLSTLNEGGYIKMSNGKLLEIHHLPEKY